jgi:small subunit ribosomal protein S8
MSIDVIGNFLTEIRNAIMASKSSTITSFSRMNNSLAKILLQEGFISALEVIEVDGFKRLKITLKYVDRESVIHEIKRVSKPSRRRYVGKDEIPSVIGGLGVSILSTSKGLLSHKDAKTNSVGGELLCTVW